MESVEQIKIKRLDVQNGSNNLILFNSIPSNIVNQGAKRAIENEKAEYVTLQEQKLKLEKLKWHQNSVKLASAVKTKQSTSNGKENYITKKNIANIEKKNVLNEKPTSTLTIKNAKQVADILEERTKKASEWLHNEKEEFLSKKKEILKNKDMAKKIEIERRAKLEIISQKRMQKQLELIEQQELVHYPIILPHDEIPPIVNSSPPILPSTLPTSEYGTDIINQHQLRLSYDTNQAIQQIADKLADESDSLVRRPMVPRLSKSYINHKYVLHHTLSTNDIGETALIKRITKEEDFDNDALNNNDISFGDIETNPTTTTTANAGNEKGIIPPENRELVEKALSHQHHYHIDKPLQHKSNILSNNKDDFEFDNMNEPIMNNFIDKRAELKKQRFDEALYRLKAEKRVKLIEFNRRNKALSELKQTVSTIIQHTKMKTDNNTNITTKPFHIPDTTANNNIINTTSPLYNNDLFNLNNDTTNENMIIEPSLDRFVIPNCTNRTWEATYIKTIIHKEPIQMKSYEYNNKLNSINNKHENIPVKRKLPSSLDIAMLVNKQAPEFQTVKKSPSFHFRNDHVEKIKQPLPQHHENTDTNISNIKKTGEYRTINSLKSNHPTLIQKLTRRRGSKEMKSSSSRNQHHRKQHQLVKSSYDKHPLMKHKKTLKNKDVNTKSNNNNNIYTNNSLNNRNPSHKSYSLLLNDPNDEYETLTDALSLLDKQRSMSSEETFHIKPNMKTSTAISTKIAKEYRRFPTSSSVATNVDISQLSNDDYEVIQEQKLRDEVATIALRNFNQMSKVLHDVDLWCEKTKRDTLELQEKLRLRESVDSFTEHKASSPTNNSDNPYRNIDMDINLIRSSLTDRLSTQAQNIFHKIPSVPNQSSRHSSFASDDNNDDGDGDDLVSEEQKQYFELDDTVLMAEDDVESEEDENDSNDDDLIIHNKDSNNYVHTSTTHKDVNKQEVNNTTVPIDNVANKPIDSVASTGLIFLNTDKIDRPIIWAPKSSFGSLTNIESLLSEDPFLAHQLGMIVDRNEIFSRYNNENVEILSHKVNLPEIKKSNNYRSNEMFSNVKFAEDLIPTSHFIENTNAVEYNYYQDSDYIPESLESNQVCQPTKHTPSVPVPVISLRNAGELAGLLRHNYRTQREAEAINDDSDSSSENDGEFDNYSVISIFANEMINQINSQAKELKTREEELVRQSIKNLPNEIEEVVKEHHVAASTMEQLPKEKELGNIPEENDDTSITFWDTLIQRSQKYNLDDLKQHHVNDINNENHRLSSEVVEEVDVDTDAMLHDFIMNLKNNSEIPSSKANSTPQSEQKIKFSGAEMRRILSDELRRQDELMMYTIELSELEKTNALQSARDLSHQASQKSALELTRMQQQQELEIQRLAYENSLAISLANTQSQMEQQSLEQKEHLIRLQSQLNAQEMQRQYQELLHQADKVAGNLDLNQQLLFLEKKLHEERLKDEVTNMLVKQEVLEAQLRLSTQMIPSQFNNDTIKVSNNKVEENVVVLEDEDDNEVNYDESFEQVTQSIIEEQSHQSSHYSNKPKKLNPFDQRFEVSMQSIISEDFQQSGMSSEKNSVLKSSIYTASKSSSSDSSKNIKDESNIIDYSLSLSQGVNNKISSSYSESIEKPILESIHSVSDDDDMNMIEEVIIDDIVEVEEEENYSDTFENSDSKSSKQIPTIVRNNQSDLFPNLSESSSNNDSDVSENIANMVDIYRKDMELRLKAQEKTYKLRAKLVKAKQLQRLEWLDKVTKNQQITSQTIKNEKQKIFDQYNEDIAELERERWILNSRTYKELKKFKHFKSDLELYNQNLLQKGIPKSSLAEFNARLFSKNKMHDSLDSFSSSVESNRNDFLIKKSILPSNLPPIEQDIVKVLLPSSNLPPIEQDIVKVQVVMKQASNNSKQQDDFEIEESIEVENTVDKQSSSDDDSISEGDIEYTGDHFEDTNQYTQSISDEIEEENSFNDKQNYYNDDEIEEDIENSSNNYKDNTIDDNKVHGTFVVDESFSFNQHSNIMDQSSEFHNSSMSASKYDENTFESFKVEGGDFKGNKVTTAANTTIAGNNEQLASGQISVTYDDDDFIEIENSFASTNINILTKPITSNTSTAIQSNHAVNKESDIDDDIEEDIQEESIESEEYKTQIQSEANEKSLVVVDNELLADKSDMSKKVEPEAIINPSSTSVDVAINIKEDDEDDDDYYQDEEFVDDFESESSSSNPTMKIQLHDEDSIHTDISLDDFIVEEEDKVEKPSIAVVDVNNIVENTNAPLQSGESLLLDSNNKSDSPSQVEHISMKDKDNTDMTLLGNLSPGSPPDVKSALKITNDVDDDFEESGSSDNHKVKFKDDVLNTSNGDVNVENDDDSTIAESIAEELAEESNEWEEAEENIYHQQPMNVSIDIMNKSTQSSSFAESTINDLQASLHNAITPVEDSSIIDIAMNDDDSDNKSKTNISHLENITNILEIDDIAYATDKVNKSDMEETNNQVNEEEAFVHEQLSSTSLVQVVKEDEDDSLLSIDELLDEIDEIEEQQDNNSSHHQQSTPFIDSRSNNTDFIKSTETLPGGIESNIKVDYQEEVYLFNNDDDIDDNRILAQQSQDNAVKDISEAIVADYVDMNDDDVEGINQCEENKSEELLVSNTNDVHYVSQDKKVLDEEEEIPLEIVKEIADDSNDEVNQSDDDDEIYSDYEEDEEFINEDVSDTITIKSKQDKDNDPMMVDSIVEVEEIEVIQAYEILDNKELIHQVPTTISLIESTTNEGNNKIVLVDEVTDRILNHLVLQECEAVLSHYALTSCDFLLNLPTKSYIPPPTDTTTIVSAHFNDNLDLINKSSNSNNNSNNKSSNSNNKNNNISTSINSSLQGLPSLIKTPITTDKIIVSIKEEDTDLHHTTVFDRMIFNDEDDDDDYDFNIPSSTTLTTKLISHNTLETKLTNEDSKLTNEDSKLTNEDSSINITQKPMIPPKIIEEPSMNDLIELKANVVIRSTKVFLENTLNNSNQPIILVDKLNDPNYRGSFIEESINYNEVEDQLLVLDIEVLKDRITEICKEIHTIKHNNISYTLSNPKQYIIQQLSMNEKLIKEYISNQIIQEQTNMNRIMQSKMKILDQITIQNLDDFKQINIHNITESCNNIADTILTRCLIEIVHDFESNYELNNIFN